MAEDKRKPKDIPIQEALTLAQKWMDNGCTVFFKFTCGNCSARQTFSEPNTLYAKGKCEECGHITALKEAEFMVIKVSGALTTPLPGESISPN